MPSPHKLRGSFLNKAVSPNMKISPAKMAPSPKAASAKKKALGFDSLDEKVSTLSYGYLSDVVTKPAFYICENKDADQLRGNREADQRLCFR